MEQKIVNPIFLGFIYDIYHSVSHVIQAYSNSTLKMCKIKKNVSPVFQQ